MSAEVEPKCGHTAHLFDEIDMVNGAPQIHVHHLTEAWEANEFGFQKAEMCCHGCGASALIVYSVPQTVNEVPSREFMSVREGFLTAHRKCKSLNRGKCCPNFRSSFAMYDFRRPDAHHVKLPELPHPSVLSKPNRRPIPRPRRR